MGFKKRDFTGRIKAAISTTLTEKGALSRRQLLEELRSQRALKPSVRRVGIALERLLKSGRVIQVGTRNGARFRLATA